LNEGIQPCPNSMLIRWKNTFDSSISFTTRIDRKRTAKCSFPSSIFLGCKCT
jgi:hypothetical protein